MASLQSAIVTSSECSVDGVGGKVVGGGGGVVGVVVVVVSGILGGTGPKNGGGIVMGIPIVLMMSLNLRILINFPNNAFDPEISNGIVVKP